MRTCPHCLTLTPLPACPRDGFATIASDQYVAPLHRLSPGHTINDRYKVRGLVGSGGFGAVYKGLHLGMDQTVAIKVLTLSDSVDRDEQVRRFHREALAASRLSHPNTIRVFDFGQSEDGFLYMVLEFVDGASLLEQVRRDGVLPPDRALHILRQLLRSLSEAHEAGIVHRDVKPENVLISRHTGIEDHVKVLDFGIAKVLSSDSNQSSLTGAGKLFGTPTYMSPEQIKGQGVDARSDLYACGAVLYYMLVGRPPFVGDGVMTILYAHCEEPVPELPLDAGAGPLPRSLDRYLRRLLAKRPADRPESAAAALAELETLERLPAPEIAGLRTVALDRPPDLRRSSHSLGLGVLLGLLAALGALGAWLGWPASDAPPLSPTAPAVSAPPQATLAGSPEPASPSPGADSGRTLASPTDPPPRRRQQFEEPRARAPMETAPAQTQATPPAAANTAPAPTAYAVTFLCRPDAEVHAGGERLGTTPLMVRLEASEEPRTFEFVATRRGYEPTRQQVVIDHDQVVEVRLQRRTRRPAATPTPPRPGPEPQTPGFERL